LTDGGGEAIDRRTSVDGEMAFLQGINAGIGADSVALGVLLSLFVVFAVAGKCYFFYIFGAIKYWGGGGGGAQLCMLGVNISYRLYQISYSKYQTVISFIII